eukprot:145412-Chlamydomonas_euryale.AAC.2
MASARPCHNSNLLELLQFQLPKVFDSQTHSHTNTHTHTHPSRHIHFHIHVFKAHASVLIVRDGALPQLLALALSVTCTGNARHGTSRNVTERHGLSVSQHNYGVTTCNCRGCWHAESSSSYAVQGRALHNVVTPPPFKHHPHPHPSHPYSPTCPHLPNPAQTAGESMGHAHTKARSSTYPNPTLLTSTCPRTRPHLAQVTDEGIHRAHTKARSSTGVHPTLPHPPTPDAGS